MLAKYCIWNFQQAVSCCFTKCNVPLKPKDHNRDMTVITHNHYSGSLDIMAMSGERHGWALRPHRNPGAKSRSGVWRTKSPETEAFIASLSQLKRFPIQIV